MTEKTYNALKIIESTPGIVAAEFARRLWPDSKLHTKVSNGGHGAQSGKAAWLCAGSYAGRLRNKGFVRHHWDGYRLRGYELTAKGREAISEYKKTTMKYKLVYFLLLLPKYVFFLIWAFFWSRLVELESGNPFDCAAGKVPVDVSLRLFFVPIMMILIFFAIRDISEFKTKFYEPLKWLK